MSREGAKLYDAGRRVIATLGLNTLYIGGGTPSQLTEGQLSRLLSNIYNNVGKPQEVTVECNPDDVTDAYARHLRSCGVNRVSMGIQSFDDARLRQLHRRHDAHQALEAVEMLQRAGFRPSEELHDRSGWKEP